jgi:hypothetical protein
MNPVFRGLRGRTLFPERVKGIGLIRSTLTSRRTLVAFWILLILSVPGRPLAASPTGQPAGARSTTVLVRMQASEWKAAQARIAPDAAALDYGSFVWLELPSSELERLAARGLVFEVRSLPYTLQLGGQSFDPVREPAGLPPGWDSLPGDGPDLYLVQFTGPTQDRWLEDLRRHGLEIIQYIHPFTYIVWGDAQALERSAATPSARWHGPFVPGYRVLPEWRALDDEPMQADVLLVRVADLDSVQRRLEALGARSTGRAVLNDTFELMTATLPGSAIQAAARVPGVYSIQLEPADGGLRGEMSNQVNVNNLDEARLAFPGYQDWLTNVGLDGSGVVVATVDLGLDNNHPDLSHRLLPCTGQSCAGDESSSHGTHTAGIIAGDGSSGISDTYGFLRGLGMAPGANLVEQLYFPWYSQAGGMLLLMAESVRNGAVLSSNSWGPSGTPQGYDNDTMQVDIGVRDADPDAPGNQPLHFVLSLMNGYGEFQTQGTPDEAKNTLTVGSTKMQSDLGAQNLAIDDLSFNTAHGPALDGRTIPHLVAPGCYVDSSVLGGSYQLICGTSMAAPQVSGTVALFIQRYRDLHAGVDPSPALVKAAFLAVAHDLSGHLDADGLPLEHRFDSKQGWGRLDAEAVLDPQQPVRYYDSPIIFDGTGEEWTQALQVDPPGQPLCLMLAWTDAPGHGLGGTTPAWNNDLDLLVEVGGNVYRGNSFGLDGLSQPGGAADFRNNTEGVFLHPGTAVSVTVRVIASNIAWDGVPHHGDQTDQDFALVCYNCRLPSVYYLPLISR